MILTNDNYKLALAMKSNENKINDILTDNIYVIKTSFYFEIIALVINFI